MTAHLRILTSTLLCIMIVRLAAMATPSLQRLPNLLCPIFGHRETTVADGGIHDKQPLKEAWGLRSGVYTPKQLVESFAPLLDSVVHHLGHDPVGSKPARARLLDNVASNLATNTREATLRLAEPLDISRREMNTQAIEIGKSLVQWARDYEPDDPKADHVDIIHLRSPCEGHLLTPSNVDLMFGDRSQPHLMQLFNEYMHQMVLLRDALLPFQNYQDVLIPIGRKARGLRHLESARSQFLADLLTKHATQRNIVTFAKALLAPGLVHSDRIGYGFQYAQGTVLPAFLSGGPTPLHLLQYVPIKVDQSATEVVFDYQFDDYYSAPRAEIPSGIEIERSELVSCSAQKSRQESQMTDGPSIGIVSGSRSDNSCRLEMRLELADGKCVAVDLGQISRGHRYSYMAERSSVESANGTVATSLAILHDPASILETPDTSLLTAQNGGVHIIPTENSLIALAILGKIYPENIVILPRDQEISLADKAGKGFGPKFVIWGGAGRGGLKGIF